MTARPRVLLVSKCRCGVGDAGGDVNMTETLHKKERDFAKAKLLLA